MPLPAQVSPQGISSVRLSVPCCTGIRLAAPGSLSPAVRASVPTAFRPVSCRLFATERWSRDRIKNALYNPRTIDRFARQKLEADLKKVGLLAPLTVNRRTGNIVGGHQRLASTRSMGARTMSSTSPSWTSMTVRSGCRSSS